MRSRVAAISCLLVCVALVTATISLSAVPSSANDNVANPDLAGACGIDLTLIIDRSGSIGDNDVTVRNAAQPMIDAVEGTGGLVKLVRFSTNAEGLGATGTGGADADFTGTLANVGFRDPAGITLPAGGFNSSGGTNWDDGLEVVRRSPGAGGPLVIMITDGDPTYRNAGVVNDDGVTTNGHGTGLGGDGSTVSASNVDEAEDEADELQKNSHMFVIGVGAALNNSASRDRIKAISGPDRLEGADGTIGTGDDVAFGKSDYTLVQDFDDLAALMRSVAIELCAPSLTIRKLLIPVGGTKNTAVPQGSWPFTTFVEDYAPTWQTPASSLPGQPNRASLSTDASGFTNFKWEPPSSTPAAVTDLEFSETLPALVAYDSTSCTRNSFNGNPPTPLTLPAVTVDGAKRTIRLAGAANNIGPEQAITCTVYNRTMAPSTIRVDKDTVPDLTQSFAFTLYGQANGQGAALGSTSANDATLPANAVLSSNLAPGTYSVIETAAANFSQSANECTRVSPAPEITASASSIPVGEGQTWECDFTNTAATGSITVVKNTVGARVGTFGFAETVPGTFPGGSVGSFALTTANYTASTTLSGVTPTLSGQPYSITENNATPWSGSANGSCTSSAGGSFASNAIVVAPGANITCTFTNTAPAPTISVTKDAQPATVAETGGPVTYTVGVTNNSAVESVTVTSISDVVEGVATAIPAAGDCDTFVGTVIAALQTATCSFTLTVSEANDANGNDVVPDTITVGAVDFEGTTMSDSDSASVALSNVVPTISIDKTAAPVAVSEPGGNVTYTVTVTNQSAQDAVSITSLQDVIEGAPTLNLLSNHAITSDCDLNFVLPLLPKTSRTCAFTVPVSGDPATMTPDDVVTDTVTAAGIDDDLQVVPPVSASADVVVQNVAPTITVDKQAPASVQEPATTATFTVVITNTSAEPVTVTSIVDSFPGFGSVDFLAPAQAANTTCDTADLQLAAAPGPGHTVTCTFTVPLGSNDGDSTITDTVVVTADDDEAADPSNPAAPSATATDTATITIVDALPSITVAKSASPNSVVEPGGNVVFTVGVHNTGVEPLRITGVSDAVPGLGALNVLGLGGATNCDEVVAGINAEADSGLDPQASFQCTFTLNVVGNPADLNPDQVRDVVTVGVVDDDGNDVDGTAAATVQIVDMQPSVTVTKVAESTTMPEPGGNFHYTLTVTNNRSEAATITSITDAPTAINPANSDCDELVGTVLAGNASTSCSFILPFTGNAGASLTDTATAVLTDDEGNTATDTDTAVVTLSDVAPTIAVTKEANDPGNADDVIAEPGGPVSYTVTITNTSAVDPVVVRSVADVFDGAAPVGRCADLIGETITPGASLSCTYIVSVADKDAGDAVTNTVTVGVNDDDGPGTPTGEVTATATEVVTVTDTAPGMTVRKEVVDGSGEVIPNPAVTEPGGPVRFKVTVTNVSTDTLTLTTIEDAVFDDAGIEPAVADTTCDLVGEELAPGASASCTFTLDVAGNPGGGIDDVRDRFTVTAEDDDADAPDNGPDVTAFDDVVVNVIDAPPVATVDKSANVSSISEPGGEVTFAVAVTNDSTTEALTITAISDVVEGVALDITKVASPVTATTCASLVGTQLAPEQTNTCNFTVALTGNAFDAIGDRVTVTLDDDEVGNPITPSDDYEVTVTDVPPTVVVTKTNGDGTVAAPGENVEFTVNVQNTSPEAVTITSITDTIGNGDPFDVTAPATAPVVATDCETGVVLAAAGAATDDDVYTCTFTLLVASTEAFSETDRVDVAVRDDDTDDEPVFSDQATTTVTAVADLSVDKGIQGSVGATGVYTLSVANAGPSTAVGVVVTDTLPVGLTAVSATGNGWTCAISNGNRTVLCTRPVAAPGSVPVITLSVVVANGVRGSAVTNTVKVENPTNDPDLTNNTDTRTDNTTAVLGETLSRTGFDLQRWLATACALLLLGLAILLEANYQAATPARVRGGSRD